MSDVTADIVELEQLLAKCKRPRVKALLQEYIVQLKSERAARSASTTDDHKPASSSTASPAPPKPVPIEMEAAPTRATPAPSVPPVRLSVQPATAGSDSVRYVPISSFGWDQDGYGKEPNNVLVYIMSGMEGVGKCKDRVQCAFTKRGFDLKVLDFNGKNYRLFKENLDKDIVPEESKCIVKDNKITLKLRKVKGQYGYDNWMDLTSKQKRSSDDKDKDPSQSIMDMMKQMYDDGDDQMKKTLGEAMLKSRQQQQRGGGGDDLDDFGKF